MRSNTILLVDDDVINLDIMSRHLRNTNFDIELANGGEPAWQLLSEQPDRYRLVLLDRMMPDLDGLEVLERMKAHNELRFVPVIMQTAASAPEQVSEGIAKGVFYYLTKPFDGRVLLSLVHTASADYDRLFDLQNSLAEAQASMHNLRQAEYHFRAIDEGMRIVQLLAQASADPPQTTIGLTELVVNAVEHGNLEIDYDEKGALIEDDRWETEIERRLGLPEYSERFVTLRYQRTPSSEHEGHDLLFVITDQGTGFDWEKYLQFSLDRNLDTHGRGVLMACSSFIAMQYDDSGTCVTARVRAAQVTH